MPKIIPSSGEVLCDANRLRSGEVPKRLSFDRRKPLAIDLFAGLGGWSEGLLAEGWDVIGFDIERHSYGDQHYPAQLVLQDVLTIHGSQFKNADLIVCSPPCQNYSYLAMPWSRSPDMARPCGDGWEVLNSAAAKEMREEWERQGPDNRLFDACFRIQREACEAAGRFIPLVVENVRGAIPWVGRSAWNYGSFHLWGDVPALMPINLKRGQKVPGFRFDGSGKSFQTASVEHSQSGDKGHGGSWFFRKGDDTAGDPRDVRRGPDGEYVMPDGTKVGGDWFRDPACHSKHGSRSKARKAASAQIAKIPLPLSTHIARVYYPKSLEKAS